MDRFVAAYNLEHYRKRLAEETDQAKRETIAKLLAEEEANLAALTDQLKERKRS